MEDLILNSQGEIAISNQELTETSSNSISFIEDYLKEKFFLDGYNFYRIGDPEVFFAEAEEGAWLEKRVNQARDDSKGLYIGNLPDVGVSTLKFANRQNSLIMRAFRMNKKHTNYLKKKVSMQHNYAVISQKNLWVTTNSLTVSLISVGVGGCGYYHYIRVKSSKKYSPNPFASSTSELTMINRDFAKLVFNHNLIHKTSEEVGEEVVELLITNIPSSNLFSQNLVS